MTNFKTNTLKQYSDLLSKKTPAPGGGSAAAYVACLAVSLLSMVANYSLGKGKPKSIESKIKKVLTQSEKLRKRLLELVDLDAKAYLKVVQSRGKSAAIKRKALNEARAIPREVGRLSYKAMDLAPLLVKDGNKNLLCDVEVAIELLLSAYRSAQINIEVNS